MDWLFFTALSLWVFVPWRTIRRRQQEERARQTATLVDGICRAFEALEIRLERDPDIPEERAITTPESADERRLQSLR